MKRLLFLLTIFCATASTVEAQGYRNPVLPGLRPDPSVCRAGDYYYVVNSSFQFFPGVPIHRSKDLIHWELIGHCLTRRSQLELQGANYWLGIYAPTIRHRDGRFYMTTTNVPAPGNFYVYADDPAGPWSEPILVDQGGIDPDLFFDDDGNTYFLSTDAGCIRICRIDLATGRKLTPTRALWRGTGGRHPEAPHLYKKDGYYYLLIAEGGTEYGHKVTIARSRSLDEPFEPNPSNPILTHINSNASANPIQGVGHADLIQAHDGSWWLVALGFRPQSHAHHLLGRETFLAPVRWDENAWPVVNGNGTISLDMECPTLPQVPVTEAPARTEFDSQRLPLIWSFLCNPVESSYSLDSRKGYLRLNCTPVTLDEYGVSPTFVCRPQQHIAFRATAAIDASALKEGARTGLSIYMAPRFRYDIDLSRVDGKLSAAALCHLSAIEHTASRRAVDRQKVYLRVEGSADFYDLYLSPDDRNYELLGRFDTRFLSTETAGGFTGIQIGLYAEGPEGSHADVDWFEYLPLEEPSL